MNQLRAMFEAKRTRRAVTYVKHWSPSHLVLLPMSPFGRAALATADSGVSTCPR